MIIFESVTKRFGEESTALHDVSFQITDGELVVLTGHSGSGKTTLMKLLTKEYLPTEGEIIFNEMPLSQIGSGQLPHHRRQLGVVFQDYKLLSELNVWENIALALNIMGKPQSEIEERVTDLLRLVELVDKAFLFPSQLSGGEAQRVSIARALATAPMVIFADEPTGNLDPETSNNIAKLLQKINDLGTTVIIATHDVTVMDALTKERHLQLDKGRVVKDTGSKDTKPKKSDSKPKEIDSKADSDQPQPKKSAPKLGLPKINLPFGKKKPTSSDEEEVSVSVETLE